MDAHRFTDYYLRLSLLTKYQTHNAINTANSTATTNNTRMIDNGGLTDECFNSIVDQRLPGCVSGVE
jgi:hypothetical protein